VLLVPYDNRDFRLMLFVDGQALAAVYDRTLAGRTREDHVEYVAGEFVWSDYLNLYRYGASNVLKRAYYTSSAADAPGRNRRVDQIQRAGIQTARVFARGRRRRTPAVEVALTTDLLTHAHRRSFDAAILVAGSAAYVPAAEAVLALGGRLYVWFFAHAVSPGLRRRAEHFFDVGRVLFLPTERLAEYFS
jgi:hypothetical protein